MKMIDNSENLSFYWKMLKKHGLEGEKPWFYLSNSMIL